MEIIHFNNDKIGLKIESLAHKFNVEFDGRSECFYAELSFAKRLLSKFRLARRLFRLDKSNAFPVFGKDKALKSVVFIYQSVIYNWNLREFKKVYELDGCRNVMHGAITQTDEGKIYFGEYGANKERERSVPIYCSDDHGESWHIVYEFLPGQTKHVHNIQWDSFDKKLWVCTGDKDGECHVLLADSNFENVKYLGDGSQKWRTCHFFFERDVVIWGMDSPLEQCFVLKFWRETGALETLTPVSGPVWYGRKISSNEYIFSTSVEPGVNCRDQKAKIYYSNNLHEWSVIFEIEKDFWPYAFKFGSIFFSQGCDESSNFFVGFEAVKELDGKMLKFDSLGLIK